MTCICNLDGMSILELEIPKILIQGFQKVKHGLWFLFSTPTVSFQFVEEARKNAIQGPSTPPDLMAARRHQTDGEKKKKKTWKTSLFSWLKNSKSTNQHINNATVSRARPGHISGPIPGTVDISIATGRIKTRGTASGPLSGLFSSTRAEDHEVPYMSLGKTSYPQQVHPYGPVYLVT